MAASERLYWFSFTPGEMATWAFDLGGPNGKGLFHPKFSGSGAVMEGVFPDHGLIEGRGPDLIYGERLPPEFQAKLRNPLPAVNTQSRDKKGRLPADINRMGDGCFNNRPLVSDSLRRAIEDLEPERHQFIPVSFVNGDLDPPAPVWTDQPWHYFNLLNWCAPDEFFNVEAMAGVAVLRTRPDGRGALSFGSSNEKKYVIRRSCLEAADSDLFVCSSYFRDDLTYVLIERSFYCTERARRHFKAAGLKGGHFLEVPVA